ncbi:MAG: lysylphosphatidylglycerol synthase domain-containing protein, partial [Gemmatimonadota bacterium]
MSGPGLVSVLVPVRERPEPLAELYREYAEPLRDAGLPFEFVVICEPWFETLGTPLLELAERGEPITVLQLGQGVGEATMLKVAGAKARGDVLVTLPAYRRVQAAVLVDLVAATREADLALAVRWPRRDSWINRVQNRWFHRLVRWFTGSHFRDLACGVRALRRRVLEETPLYGDFFRFLPLLAQREGFHVVELEAEQHQGDNQPRVYSPGIYLRRLIDLLGMFFLLRFTEKPLRFFGLVGSISALLGAAVLGVVSVQRLQGEPLADRPVLLLGVLLLVLGAQAVALGLVGEMIVFHHAHQRRRYRLAENVRELTADRALPSADERSGRAVGADDEDGPSGGSPAAGSAATPPSAGSGAGEPAPPGDRGAVRSSWTTWARLAIGVGLLGVLLSRVDLSQRTIRIGAEVVLGVGVTGALLLLAQAVSALRWKEILGAQAPAWGFLFRLYLIGNFFSLFLPTSVGGDAVRAVAASRALPARAAAVTSVVVDRLIGVAALLAYLALGVVAAPAVIARAGAAAEWRVPWLPVAAAVVVS